ncbi:MAG: glycosyltransferase family 2 protein [Candidatus Obscuribacterales bacterium]|nr:glycosyltransferase family 2 protein [Candidatus Obscuribacterales bacterium]
MQAKKLSILMPVFNETKTVIAILEAVSAADTCGLDKEIIVVDDGSTDGTRKILEELDPAKYAARIFFHDKNQGKGAALRTAQSKAEGDIILIQDADLEYSPDEYPNLLRPILQGHADVVYGSRLSGGAVTRAFNFTHYVGNKFLTLLTNILYNCTITDMETCYKVFKSEVFKKVIIRSNRFDFEPEITAKILKQGVRIYELPISYYGRDYSEGKKITWVDGFGAIWALLKYRFVD